MRDGHRGRHGQREQCENKNAQTFRRGRALSFLEKLQRRRTTLQRQVNDPDLEAIKPVISGELKATESIMDEFIRVFQLYENENASEEQPPGGAPNASTESNGLADSTDPGEETIADPQ
ncbi:hypothetical protein [Cohnella fermenti]|uniref:hypothetical protein n=1 Tax=Cohnella fermenti TaxID=2565925 RepID=UPI001B3B2190|nr:hypothetical protein [Cohnella fermenti]